VNNYTILPLQHSHFAITFAKCEKEDLAIGNCKKEIWRYGATIPNLVNSWPTKMKRELDHRAIDELC